MINAPSPPPCELLRINLITPLQLTRSMPLQMSLKPLLISHPPFRVLKKSND